ncbi:MAG: hypothetical protein AAFW95_02735 [Cyanobacteria bacterium J06638_6]
MSTTPKWMPPTAIALVSFELGLGLAYFSTIFVRGEAIPLLDLNGLRSLPSWLQAAHLFAIGSLCIALLRHRHRMVHPISWFLPSMVAVLCFYGGLDELTKLHLWLNQVDWKLIYLGWLMAIPVLGRRDLVTIWRHHRRPMLWVLAGISVFVLGGFGAEAARGAIASELATYHSSRLLFLGEHLRVTLEESAELIGETIVLYGIARFTQQSLYPQPAMLAHR